MGWCLGVVGWLGLGMVGWLGQVWWVVVSWCIGVVEWLGPSGGGLVGAQGWWDGDLWIVVLLKKECSFSGCDMWGGGDTQSLQDGKKNFWTLCTKSVHSSSLALALPLVLVLEIRATWWNFHYLIFPILSLQLEWLFKSGTLNKWICAWISIFIVAKSRTR